MMQHRYWLVPVALYLFGGAAAQAQLEIADPAKPVAYATVLAGDGAERVDGEIAVRLEVGDFSTEENGIPPGSGLRTGEGGRAVLFLPDFDAVLYLGGSTELRFRPRADAGDGIPFSIVLIRGSVSLVRKPASVRWLLFEGLTGPGGFSGYTLSHGASVVAEADPRRVTFGVFNGSALYYSGAAPEVALIAPSGLPVDPSGLAISAGHRISSDAPQKFVADERSGVNASRELSVAMSRFALAETTDWLQEAEKGDFTPVRSAARGVPELLSPEFEPSLVFDQPRPVLAAPAPSAAETTAIRGQLNPAQPLLESNIPGSVIAGQRFRRSIIIGSPGAGGFGAIRVNPAVERLILLGGN